jgi:hypothetical protein
MAKKKKVPVKKSRVSPVIPTNDARFTSYKDLNNGDAFLWKGALYVKCESCDQEAIDMETGYVMDGVCDTIVEPVSITITWKKK